MVSNNTLEGKLSKARPHKPLLAALGLAAALSTTACEDQETELCTQSFCQEYNDYYYGPVRQCKAYLTAEPGFQEILEPQHESQWCWAASISMVFGFYGHPVSQERIVMETWGAPYNMPGTPEVIMSNLNKTWIDDNGMPFTVSGDTYSTNAYTSFNDLSCDHPVIIGTHAHAMVLTEMTYTSSQYYGDMVNSAGVLDPFYGPRYLAPDEWNYINFAARIRVEGESSQTAVPPDEED